MITTVPKTPNVDSLLMDGGPKSAFKCVQRRCRSPSSLNNLNDMKMTNSSSIQLSPPSVIKSLNAIPPPVALNQQSMFPHIFLPSSLLQSESQHNPDRKFSDIVNLAATSNTDTIHHKSDCAPLGIANGMDQIATLAHIRNSLGNRNERKNRYHSNAEEHHGQILPQYDTHLVKPAHTAIYGAICNQENGTSSLSNDINQEIGLNRARNIMYQTLQDEDCIFGTRVPPTSQSDKCHQRTRSILQQNQSPEKIRRYK